MQLLHFKNGCEIYTHEYVAKDAVHFSPCCMVTPVSPEYVWLAPQRILGMPRRKGNIGLNATMVDPST